MLTCIVCKGPFRRAGSRGPVPRYCSQRCITKSKRTDQRRAYEREYRRERRARGLDLTDNVARRDYYRERWRRLYGDPHSGVVIPSPYTGHKWLDMAREAVGRDVDPEFRDFGYDDEVGEALLALLEGRDVDKAVHDFRKREFVPRHLTLFLGDWKNEEGEERESSLLPTVPSAEDEVVAMEVAGAFSVPHRMNWKPNPRRGVGSTKSKTQPSRKRQKDGKSWQKHAA